MSLSENELSALEARIAVLNRVPRTGWLIRGVEQPEAVGDHVFGASVLAMLYDDQVKPGGPPVIAMPLVHDLQEISTGDLTHRTKPYVQPYEEFERKHFQELVSAFPKNAQAWFIKNWEEFEAERTPRAKAAHIIDVVEMLSQAYEYEKTGQRKLDEFWQWVPRCAPVPALFELARAIERKRFFLRAGANQQYQHFEATTHHAGKGFAEKLSGLERDRQTGRDEVVKQCVSRWCPDAEKEPLRVLDVGCGTGSFARCFLENEHVRHEVVGIDINMFLLDEAQRRWRNKSFTAKRADIGWYWDFESESFDAVLVGEVLEHLFDPWFAMREAFRVLRPHGLLLVSVPNSFHKDKVQRMLRQERIELRYREEHIRYFSPTNLHELLSETGFNIHEMWGLSPAWDDYFRLSNAGGDSAPAREGVQSGSPAGDAWTILSCAARMSCDEIEQVRNVQGPGRHDPVRPLADWIRDHNSTQGWSRIHSFLEEINKAKLLKVDSRNLAAETVAQQTFRLAAMGCCLALLDSPADPDEAAAATVRCALLQGMVESHLAEIALNVRGGLATETRRRALHDVLGCLPGDLIQEYLSIFDGQLMGSGPGAIVRFLLRRDYERLGVVTTGNPYFDTQQRDGPPESAADEPDRKG